MSTTPEAMLLATFRHRLAEVLGIKAGDLPTSTAAIWDMVGPALADHKRTRDKLAIDFRAYALPGSDADGPLSLYQMTEAVVVAWRDDADALDNARRTLYSADADSASNAADLAEVRTRLSAADYVPTAGETLGDVVARAIADTRAADAARDELEQTVERLTAERDAARASADDIARVLIKANELSTFTATVLREHTANNR